MVESTGGNAKTRTLTPGCNLRHNHWAYAAKATENNRLLTWQNSSMIELQQHTFDAGKDAR